VGEAHKWDKPSSIPIPIPPTSGSFFFLELNLWRFSTWDARAHADLVPSTYNPPYLSPLPPLLCTLFFQLSSSPVLICRKSHRHHVEGSPVLCVRIPTADLRTRNQSCSLRECFCFQSPAAPPTIFFPFRLVGAQSFLPSFEEDAELFLPPYSSFPFNSPPPHPEQHRRSRPVWASLFFFFLFIRFSRDVCGYDPPFPIFFFISF